MTVTGTASKQTPYDCDGVTILFVITLDYFDPTDIQVTLRSAAGVEDPLIYHTDYDVPLYGEENYGKVVLIGTYAASPPVTGTTLLIKRVLPLSQLVEFIEHDDFSPTDMAEAVDRLIMVCQQLQEQINRAALLLETSSATLVIPEPEANKYLGTDVSSELEFKD